MNNIYQYQDYKIFINDWVEQRPNQGHGELRKMAYQLNVSSTMMSQVFRGQKHLSLETACELIDYLGLTDDEGEYFLLLVDFNRAGSSKLEKKLLTQVKKRQEKARQLENRLKKDISLSPETRAIYYSNWLYGAVRILASINTFHSVEAISEHLKLPRSNVQNVLNFLVEQQLIAIEKGKYKSGPTKTHISAKDPLVIKHHQNWRLQAFNKMQLQNESDFFLTAPFAVSKEVAELLRKELPSFVEKVQKLVGPSDSEELWCLNIDYFSV
jgi:uncharacterized protein (TIGR02147 family)